MDSSGSRDSKGATPKIPGALPEDSKVVTPRTPMSLQDQIKARKPKISGGIRFDDIRN